MRRQINQQVRYTMYTYYAFYFFKSLKWRISNENVIYLAYYMKRRPGFDKLHNCTLLYIIFPNILTHLLNIYLKNIFYNFTFYEYVHIKLAKPPAVY